MASSNTEKVMTGYNAIKGLEVELKGKHQVVRGELAILLCFTPKILNLDKK